MMKKVLSLLLCGLMLFAFTACGEEKTAKEEETVKDVNVQDIQDKIAKDLGIEPKAMTDTALTKRYGLPEGSVAQSASFFAPGEVFDEEIFLIKATDGDAADKIEAKLQEHLESLRSQAADYSPDTKAILDKCEVIRKGDYVALFFSAKRAEMEGIFEKAFQ